MRKHRTVKFDADIEVLAEDLAKNDRFIDNVQIAVLTVLCKRGRLSQRQFDLCVKNLGRGMHSGENKDALPK